MLGLKVAHELHEYDVREPDHDHSWVPEASLAARVMELQPLVGWLLLYRPQTSKLWRGMAVGKKREPPVCDPEPSWKVGDSPVVTGLSVVIAVWSTILDGASSPHGGGGGLGGSGDDGGDGGNGGSDGGCGGSGGQSTPA